MGRLTVLSSGGDQGLEWNPQSQTSVKVAQRVFEQLRQKGCAAYVDSGDGEGGRRLDVFDPSAEEIVVIRPLVGGG